MTEQIDRQAVDLALLAKYRDGDEDAFRVLYDYYAPRLQAKVRLNGYVNAEDIVQQVFCDFHAHRGREIHNVCGYLYNLLHHRTVDYIRYALSPCRNPACETRMVELPVNDNEVEKRDSIQHLQNLIDKLPPHERGCLRARALGYSYTEYAAEIQMTVDTVKSWTHSGLERLKNVCTGN